MQERVTRFVRKAKLEVELIECARGWLIDLSTYKDVPTSVCTAQKTSLIACHGSTRCDCDSQHKVVDQAVFPTVPLGCKTVIKCYRPFTMRIEGVSAIMSRVSSSLESTTCVQVGCHCVLTLFLGESDVDPLYSQSRNRLIF